ncbi:MAG TPA: hypothetical protein VFI56_23205 [Vicinamibacterales bacterium]|nr:hypothetical protein [Vicinamibacterales bacterium]
MSTWTPDVEKVKLEQWRAALVAAGGNITHAAKATEISRAYATVLMKRFDLIEFAAQLRARAGAGALVRGGERQGVVTGRPRKR